jgi:hypothetical protein
MEALKLIMLTLMEGLMCNERLQSYANNYYDLAYSE